MVDCLEEIKEFLVFDSPDDFYYLQILQRKKENPQLGSNSRVIKNYYIRSIEYLESHYEEIKQLCILFNARASLRLNRRSFEKVGFKSLENVANTMQNREYSFLMKSYDRACGLLNNEKVKKWIIDVDKEELGFLIDIYDTLDLCDPPGLKVLKELPTKSGVHIITSPFNVTQFKEILKDKIKTINPDLQEVSLALHKDNPINLYIP